MASSIVCTFRAAGKAPQLLAGTVLTCSRLGAGRSRDRRDRHRLFDLSSAKLVGQEPPCPAVLVNSPYLRTHGSQELRGKRGSRGGRTIAIGSLSRVLPPPLSRFLWWHRTMRVHRLVSCLGLRCSPSGLSATRAKKIENGVQIERRLEGAAVGQFYACYLASHLGQPRRPD